MTADLAQAFATSGKAQLSVMEVDGPDISKYGVVVPNGAGAGIAGLVENLMRAMHLQQPPSDASDPDIFDTLRVLKAGSGGEIQLADAINIHAQHGAVAAVRLMDGVDWIGDGS